MLLGLKNEIRIQTRAKVCGRQCGRYIHGFGPLFLSDVFNVCFATRQYQRHPKAFD